MSDSIQVAIKVRPLIKREKDENLQIQWSVVDNALVPTDPEKKRGELVFHFDHIFAPENTNNHVFETVVKPVVNAAVKGFNGTVFAYGQTSSGKTHTMLGTISEPGIIPMAVDRTFDSISEIPGREFLLRVSYLEIYNEKVHDLLDTTGLDLKLREDSNGLVHVLNCKEEVANSPDIIMNIMRKGDKNRRIGETDMNDRSSRSHTIFRITIESRDMTSDSDGAIQVSQLNLVDLAGSERARQTNATGERFKEGTHINMSLSTLGHVIKQLSDSSDSTKYVNFRDSKLTRLLQASLGGNAMTTIICAVTPAAFEETQCTLSFASRAKSVKNKPMVNEVTSDAVLLKRYKKQLSKLSDELEKLKNVNRIAEVEEMESKLQEKEHKLQQTDKMNQVLEERIELLKKSIISADSSTKEVNNSKIPRSKRRRTWAGGRALNSRFSMGVRNLPTINETCTIPESKPNAKSEMSIQNENFNDETFQMAFTDFELELIESEKERENWNEMSTPKKWKPTLNEEGEQTQDLTSSPGTPKSILREKLNYITEEYHSLQEFTTLERQMLSAQLTDDYNECLKELEQVKSEKELLFQENAELKTKLIDESNKLKNTNILVNTLRTDTDCLMEKLIQKNSELAKLKERIVELEKITEEIEKPSNSVLENSIKTNEQIDGSQSNQEQNENTEIKKLNEIIEEKTHEITKYRQFEEELKLENERLQQSLNTYLNAERKSQECQTDIAEEQSSKISGLLEMIKNQTTSITAYQQLETSLQQKVEQLQQCLDAVTKIEKSSQECQTDVINDQHDIILANHNKEMSKLTSEIEEKILEITHLKQHEEKMNQEIDRLQQCLDAASRIEKSSQECQTDIINGVTSVDLTNEISRLTIEIEEKILEIANFKQHEEQMKLEMERLQQCLDAVSKVQKSSQECQTDVIEDDVNKVDLTNEISRLTNVIEEKILEIANFKQHEEQMKLEMERLQQCLDAVSKDEKSSQECQTDVIEDDVNKVDLTNEISRLTIVIEEKILEIANFKQHEEQMKLEMERLQQCLDAVSKVQKSSQECQTDVIEDDVNKVDLTNEISRLTNVIEEKILEIANFKQHEEQMKLEMERLQQCLDAVSNVEKSSQECQTEVIEDGVNKIDLTNEISRLTIEIEEKILEIANFKQHEEQMKLEMERLQQCLDAVSKVQKSSQECQTDVIEDDVNKVDLTNEISRLTNVIEEKILEIANFKQHEEQMKLEMERLQQCLDAVSNVEKSSQECQTEVIEDGVNKVDLTNEISRLTIEIEEKILEIANFKQHEEQMKLEMERLQQCLDAVSKVQKSSQECQTDVIEDDVNKVDLTNEISRLTNVIEEKILEIANFKQHEEEMKQEIERLQIYDVISKIETRTEECQTSSFNDIQESIVMMISAEKDLEISKLEGVVKEITLEVTKSKKSEEVAKQEIERLQLQLDNVVDKVSEQCEMSNKSEIINIDKVAANEISGLLELIKLKSSEIDSYQKSENEMKMQIVELQLQLENMKKSQQISVECQTKIPNEDNLNLSKIDDVSSQNISAQDTAIEIQNLREIEQILRKENDELIARLSVIKNGSVNESVQCPSYVIETPNENEKDTRIIEQLRIIDEKTLEIENYKQLESVLRSEIQRLDSLYNELKLNQSTAVASKLTEDIPNDNKVDIVQQKLSEDGSATTIVQIDSSASIKPDDIPVDEIKMSASVLKDDKNIVELQKKKFELESSSIFANMSYFESMEISQTPIQDSTTIFTEMDESKNISNTSANINVSLANQVSQIPTPDSMALQENIENISKSEVVPTIYTSAHNLSISWEEHEKIKAALEKDIVRLSNELEKKICETDEVQKVVIDFKKTLKNLEQTINMLTNENMDMSKQLTEVRENNSVVISEFQREIDALTDRLSIITEEKISLKNELALLTEQYDNIRSATPVLKDDEMKQTFFEYQEKIKTLTDENIELSTNLMEKIEELEKIKESKIQQYDHECAYKEKSEALIGKVDELEKENIELSSDLTEQIEECDKLKETVDVMKQQLEIYAVQKSSENISDNDLEFFKQENARLSSELIELRSKLTQLTRENVNLSSTLALDNNLERKDLDNSTCGQILNALSIALESSVNEVNADDTNNISLLNKQVKSLQEQVEYLTMLNKKLGELKYTNCSQCAHLKELNESRRELKIEVKTLNQKLVDLQKQFQQKCADTDALRTKANENFNASLSMLDSTLDCTYDGANVTLIEEKVQNLHSELEELKENHSKLSNQYNEKCNELEKLNYDNALRSPSEKKETKKSKSDSSSRKNSSRIQNLQKDLQILSLDLQELKKVNANTSMTLNKFMIERNETEKELESLKLSNEELTKECSVAQTSALHHEEKVKLLEEELSTLYKRIEAANALEKEYQSQKLEIEVQLESLLKEKAEHVNYIQEAEDKFNKELKECNSRLHNYDKENNNLKNELQKLEDLVLQLKGKNETAFEEKLKEEIDSAKSRIIKEIKSLKNISDSEQNDLPKRSVTDIFVSFLNTILSKEQEIIKRIQEEFEKRTRKIEDEKQQSIDLEKRANVWAKTLETDLEKLQGDLTAQEHKNKMLQTEIHKLQENIKEACHENQQLHSKIANLETHINSLHNELDEKSKSTVEMDLAISAAQEKERQAKTRETEWENRLRREKEKHVEEIEVFNSQLQQYKSINDDLKNNVEGLDLEIEHLKNTISIKSEESVVSQSKLEELQKELEQMENVHQQLKTENIEKEKRVEDLSGFLKIKCDLLTEYKTKVETMKPEYESLRAQISERKIANEKYKEEIHALKLESKKQLDILQDKLNDAEIKSVGLNQQFVQLKNKNTDLYNTIVEFKDKCAELERENASLQRKIRNSTSKVRVENEMQELQDENRTLKNHLEGSYNRIKELQESKSQVQRELTIVQGKCELLKQDLNAVKNELEFFEEKHNNVNIQQLREKYEKLLTEKNHIALEVADKKMLIADKDQKLVENSIELDTLVKQKEELDTKLNNVKQENSLLKSRITNLLDCTEKLKSSKLQADIEKDEAYKMISEEKNQISLELQNTRKEISELLTKNKELDEEMDEMVEHVHKQESEIAELQDRIITGSYGGQDKLDKMNELENENEKIKINLRVTELNCSKLQSEIIRLNSEKEQLNSRIDDLNNKIGELESKNSSRCSSKNSSPNTQKGRRRHRRSDLYNQNRNLEIYNESRDATDTDSPSSTPTPPLIRSIDEECNACAELRTRIREMSLDLVSRNNKITMLEVQLEAENFPYQMKCNELQEKLLQDRAKNHDLKLEVQKLQRALMKDSSRECQVCRQKQRKTVEQGVQANIENKISMAGMRTGIVEDHIKMEKLERDRSLMKNLCKSRARTIKELEQRIRQLEGLKTS